MSVILNRREAVTVIAGLRLLAGDGVHVPHYPHTLVAGLCDETDPEYELRFDADEEYIRELIDRIDEMSLREVKLCNRCTAKPPGKWQGKPGKARCAECDRNVERHSVLQKGAAVSRVRPRSGCDSANAICPRCGTLPPRESISCRNLFAQFVARRDRHCRLTIWSLLLAKYG